MKDKVKTTKKRLMRDDHWCRWCKSGVSWCPEFIATDMIYARGTIEGLGILNPWVVGQAMFSSEALISRVIVEL